MDLDPVAARGGLYRRCAAAFRKLGGGRARDRGHPSPAEFDRALRGDGRSAFIAHLERCVDCRQRLLALLDEKRTRAASRALREAQAQARRATRRGWSASLRRVGGLPVVAVLGIAFLVAVRLRSGPAIEVRITRATGVSQAASDRSPVGAGDTLELVYRPGRFRQVALFRITGCAARREHAGPVSRAPLRLRLDGAAERFYLVLSRRTVEPAELERALGAAAGGCDRFRAPPLDGNGFAARGLVVRRAR